MSPSNPLQNFRFQLVRYAPDPARNEFVHIGVVLRAAEPSAGSTGLEVRLTRDWRRVRCLFPDADIAMLEGLEAELRKLGADEDGKLRRILDEALSLNLQMTDAKALLAESLHAGVEKQMEIYVNSPKVQRSERLAGRAAIHARMRDEFELAGVWDLMRKRIPAAQYTRPGDPLRIDCGYRPERPARPAAGSLADTRVSSSVPIIKMFQAVSLEPGVEMARVLAFSAASLRSGIERIENSGLELTAIIEPAARVARDDEPERLAHYRFAVETMEEHQIRVLTTADLPRVADTARIDLGVA